MGIDERLAAAGLLRQFMAEGGWTVTTLAEHTGVSPAVIRLYIKGKRMPQPNRDTGHRLAAGFDRDVQEELFDAWGYDQHERAPRRSQPVVDLEMVLAVLQRIEAKLDVLVDAEHRLDELGGSGDPKVSPIRGQRRTDRGNT